MDHHEREHWNSFSGYRVAQCLAQPSACSFQGPPRMIEITVLRRTYNNEQAARIRVRMNFEHGEVAKVRIQQLILNNTTQYSLRLGTQLGSLSRASSLA